jgi:hypothetical protein
MPTLFGFRLPRFYHLFFCRGKLLRFENQDDCCAVTNVQYFMPFDTIIGKTASRWHINFPDSGCIFNPKCTARNDIG